MISAVIHTYNEENNIERALSSLSWVDEVIVVDMESIDSTCQKARQYNTKIFTYPFTGFVEPARNFGIEKTTGKWVLILDADEEIPRTLVDHLREITSKNSHDYIRIPRKNIIFGKWIQNGGWWPDYQIRFFKKNMVKWTDQIHGVPLTRGKGIDLEPIETLSIVHHNYQTIEQFIQRLNRYSGIGAKQLFLKNQRFTTELLLEKPVSEFIHRFFVWKGYRDGIYGLSLSLLQSFSELVMYLKLWELYNFKGTRISLQKLEKQIDSQYRRINFYLSDWHIQHSKDVFFQFKHRIKRKLNSYV